MTRRVVLDANVLFPFTLRDTLLRAAAADLYQACWSAMILEEVRRNLVRTEMTTEAQANRLVATMARAFPDAMIEGFEHLIEDMANEPGDRHVAAAAVAGEASSIVTSNLRDFRRLPAGVEAVSPDDFLCGLFDARPDLLTDIVRTQAAALRRPPRTFDEIVRALGMSVPNFSTRIGARAG